MEGLYLTTDKKKKVFGEKGHWFFKFFFYLFCKQEKYLQTGNKKKKKTLLPLSFWIILNDVFQKLS